MGCSGSKAAAKPSTTEAVAPAPAPAKEAQAVTLEADAVPPTAGIVDTVEAQAGELLKPDEQGKAEDTETVTTLPKEDSPLGGDAKDVKIEGDAAAKPSTTEAVAPAAAPAKEAQAVTLEADAVPPTADIVDAVEAQAGELLKPNEQGKAEDTETVTTLPKEDSPLGGDAKDMKIEGDAPASACTCAALW
ncbi:unnamed protein product [Symbiodinium pilosum]|uniref:Uncharacterized protein n=1 Tax=Symbiodinium pilosum TaxID=2952 RepID=A0A812XG87_SYMPI|nr:unnamed protein product [Symbiodinium pilosum]